MNAREIVRLLGEKEFVSMFSMLSTQAKRELINRAGISVKRTPSLLSTEKRNLAWALSLYEAPNQQALDSFLYLWILSVCRPILIKFLDSLEVKHQEGITEDDFLKDIAQDKLLKAAQALISDKTLHTRHVAIYLLFLENSEKDQRLGSLKLEQYLPSH